MIAGASKNVSTLLRHNIGSVSHRPAASRHESLARRACQKRSMYHICPPQSQIQLLSREEFDLRREPVFAEAAAQGLSELAHAIGSGFRRRQ